MLTTQTKRLSVSQKRQITIPIEFFTDLQIQNEVDCYLQNGKIVIQPTISSGEFDEQILEDLIAQGLSGENLLLEFKKIRAKIRPAAQKLLSEAEDIASGKAKGFSMEETFD